MFDLIDDTIVAAASPPGHALRGIVRCSGPRAIPITRELISAQSAIDVDACPGFRCIRALVAVDADCTIPAEIYLFRAPRSYTRQDCVEFHVPGSPALLSMLVGRIVSLGARPAEPGEFTARAFLNGAFDLTRAEAVAALIHSRSDAQLRAARRMMDGRLAAETERILEQLAELVALVEADIDFAEEPIEFITPDDLNDRLARTADDLGRLLAASESTERFATLPQVLLVGSSNAGKSTLMNRLSGLDRAICASLPGTTRDVLSAPVSLGRCEAILLDAAGIDPQPQARFAVTPEPRASATPGPQASSRTETEPSVPPSAYVVSSTTGAGDETDNRNTVPTPPDDIPRLAADATLAAATKADLLCLVVDLTVELDDTVFAPLSAAARTPCVILANKIDVLSSSQVDRKLDALRNAGRGPVCAISARTGEGLEACRRTLAEVLHAPATALADDAVVITARQRAALEDTRAAVHRAGAEARSIGQTVDRADVIAFELREALETLGAVAGAVTTEDLLGRVFASFCIGK